MWLCSTSSPLVIRCTLVSVETFSSVLCSASVTLAHSHALQKLTLDSPCSLAIRSSGLAGFCRKCCLDGPMKAPSVDSPAACQHVVSFASISLLQKLASIFSMFQREICHVASMNAWIIMQHNLHNPNYNTSAWGQKSCGSKAKICLWFKIWTNQPFSPLQRTYPNTGKW